MRFLACPIANVRGFEAEVSLFASDIDVAKAII